MNFSCYCFLDDLLSLRLHLFTRSLDVSILTPIDDEKEVKIILQVFWKILALDDLNTKKIELHTNSEDISKVKLPSLLPSAQKSHLITWNLLVLNIFYLIPIIVLPPYQILNYWELNVVAPISSLAVHKILFLSLGLQYYWF